MKNNNPGTEDNRSKINGYSMKTKHTNHKKDKRQKQNENITNQH